VARGRGSGIEFLEALPEDGERRLMLAVLIDAIRTLGKLRPTIPYLQGHRAWLQERAWMFANDESQPFSFVSICHALGLDAGYVRRQVLRGTDASHGPARRYAAKAEESWLRLAGQCKPGASARLAIVHHAEHRGAVSQRRHSASLPLSSR
jgi:hypothetical protein